MLTDKQLLTFQSLVKDNRKLSNMDNQQLAWVILKVFDEDDEVLGRKGLILDEVVNRLYPEWDGDTIECTSTGWKTPSGDINYIKTQEVPS